MEEEPPPPTETDADFTLEVTEPSNATEPEMPPTAPDDANPEISEIKDISSAPATDNQDMGTAPATDNQELRDQGSLQTEATDNVNRKAKQIIPPINNYTINLLTLTDEEELIIRTVLDKDEEFARGLEKRIRLLQKEISTLRKEGIANAKEKNPTDFSRKCIRCRRQLGIWRAVVPIIDKGMICQRCRFRVCKACRHKQANGRWLCALCVRYREIQILTGTWVCMFPDGLNGTEIMRLSFSDAEYYRHKLLERVKRKGKKRKSRTVEEQADLLKGLKRKSEKSKTLKKDTKEKKDKKDKTNKKDQKDKKGKQDKKKDRKKSLGKDKKKKDKHKGKKKGGDKDKSKKSKDKGRKSKMGGTKHSKSKSGKKGDKKKKHGKDKSKNAEKHHRNTNASYARDNELNRDAFVENTVGISEVALEFGVSSRKKSGARSARQARTCDQHLRWQDESTDSRLVQDTTAFGDSNINDLSGQPILLGENDTLTCRHNRKPASHDRTAMSNGDHNSEHVQRARKSRVSDTEKREHHKHRSHKNRIRIHDMLSSDYLLNENKDSRNLMSSDMLTDKRDRFRGIVVLSAVSDMYILRPISSVEDVACKKRVSIKNSQTADVPKRSHDSVDARHGLRVSSEHRYKIHKYRDSHTQEVALKQPDSSYQDETYTLNTEAPKGEWEQQCCEQSDLTLYNPNGLCASIVEELAGGDGQRIGASAVGAFVLQSQSFQDSMKENSAKLLCDQIGDLMTGNSHTSILSRENKNRIGYSLVRKSHTSVISTDAKHGSGDLLIGKSHTSVLSTEAKYRRDDLLVGKSHISVLSTEAKYISDDLLATKSRTSVLSTDAKHGSGDLLVGKSRQSVLSSEAKFRSDDLLVGKSHTSVHSTDAKHGSGDLLVGKSHTSIVSTNTKPGTGDLRVGKSHTSVHSTDAKHGSGDLLVGISHTSVLSTDAKHGSGDLLVGKSHTSVLSTEAKYRSDHLLAKKSRTSVLCADDKYRSADLLVGKSHISVISTDAQYRSDDLLATKSHTSVLCTVNNEISKEVLTQNEAFDFQKLPPFAESYTKYTFSPSTSKAPPTEDIQKKPLNGRKRLASSLRNSSIVKRVTSLLSNILDYNTSAMAIRRLSRMKDINENYRVHRIAKTPDTTQQQQRGSMELEQLLKGVPQPEQKPTEEPHYQRAKSKSKFNLGDVLLKAKEHRLAQQKIELQQKQPPKVRKRIKVHLSHKESQTDTNKQSLASKLCPFCKFSIEFGVP